MELTTFSIPTFRKAAVAKRLDKLARKANRYGNTDIGYTFGKTYIREYKDSDGRNYDLEYVDIQVFGEAPQINGWQLLSRIELLGDANLIHEVPGAGTQTDNKFRTHDGHCDHCNTRRYRKDVYILTDGTDQIAVGRSCLRDFLGIDDPKAIVNRAQFFEEARAIAEEDFTIGGSMGFYLPDVFTLAAAYIRQDGYVSKAKQLDTGYSTTGESVRYALTGTPGYSIETNDEDRAWAKKVTDFFRSAESFDNNYMENIRVVVRQDFIESRHMNLVVSGVLAVQKQLAEAEQPAVTSEFVGSVQERLKGLNLILDRVIFLGSGGFGPSYLHLMKDCSGNVFSWITGNKIEGSAGTKVVLDGSVKQHKLYNGVKQTVLTRARVKSVG